MWLRTVCYICLGKAGQVQTWNLHKWISGNSWEAQTLHKYYTKGQFHTSSQITQLSRCTAEKKLAPGYVTYWFVLWYKHKNVSLDTLTKVCPQVCLLQQGNNGNWLCSESILALSQWIGSCKTNRALLWIIIFNPPKTMTSCVGSFVVIGGPREGQGKKIAKWATKHWWEQ